MSKDDNEDPGRQAEPAKKKARKDEKKEEWQVHRHGGYWGMWADTEQLNPLLRTGGLNKLIALLAALEVGDNQRVEFLAAVLLDLLSSNCWVGQRWLITGKP